MTHPIVVLTGPIRGVVTLADGREINVDPHEVRVDSLEDMHEVMDLVSRRYAVEGHPHHDEQTPFEYDAETSAANRTALEEN